MDRSLDSPLNKAHFYDRRANALIKKFCFDEAIECHLSAAKYLTESLDITDNDKAKESIALQKEYHLKQKDFLRLKKLQYQAYKEVIRVRKEAMSRVMKAKDLNGKENDELSLQNVICRTIEEADSLLDILINKDSKLPNLEGNGKDPSGDVKGTILPKDDKTIIEELRIVNYQLRTLINELMAKLTASEKEVVTLKKRVAELEAENCRLEPSFASASEYSSPFVFSPEDEMPPKTKTELPALPPLEVPNFDLSVLQKYKTAHQ
ncbi:hypothetical protein RUM43_014457 [Polyplax serrata]|uniref:Nuclear receptor-binding factor 2 MIT domain-containing protein n=1 Tax=Polyplax serrata TaxID=468196 RepID=A0AAN8NVK7_POLSC